MSLEKFISVTLHSNKQRNWELLFWTQRGCRNVHSFRAGRFLALHPKLMVFTNFRFAGSARGGDDAQRDGARQVGLLPELPPGAELDAQPRAPHRADRPGQGADAVPLEFARVEI